MSKEIINYINVEIGDTAYESPDVCGEWNSKIGTVIWKGTFPELRQTKYKNLLLDWEGTDQEMNEDYDLVVINSNEDGNILFNYNNDLYGCVCFK